MNNKDRMSTEKKVLEEKHNKFVGKKLKDLRNARGLTLREMEKTIHFTYGYVNMVENNKYNPTSFFISEISDALNVDPAYFYENSSQSNITVEQYDAKFFENDDFRPYFDLAKRFYSTSADISKIEKILGILE